MRIENNYPTIDLDFLKSTNLSWLKENLLLVCMSGSHAYGMATQNSDIDLRGICYAPKQYMLSPFRHFEQAEIKDKYDCVIFDLRKWFSLAANCNPNVLEFIFSDPNDILYLNPKFNKVIENKHLFLSKKVKHTYLGYAYSQWQRLELHRNYLLNPPPAKKPTIEEFGLSQNFYDNNIDHIQRVKAAIDKKLDSWNPNFSMIDRAERLKLQDFITTTLSELEIASIYVNKKNLWREAAVLVNIPDSVIEQLNLYYKYIFAVEEYRKYQDWLKGRNEQRAQLEAKYGFDTKFASHTMRITRQGLEILKHGTLKVKRDDYEYLLDIRNGKYTFQEMKDEFENLKTQFDEAYKTSTLPYSVNVDKLNDLCLDVLDSIFDSNCSQY